MILSPSPQFLYVLAQSNFRRVADVGDSRLVECQFRGVYKVSIMVKDVCKPIIIMYKIHIIL